MPGDPSDSRLLRVMRLLYQMQPADIDQLTEELLDREKQSWRTALEEKATQYYGRALRAYDPVGADLSFLRDMARRDAESIARTFNRSVEKQLARLFTANPRGNRHYYARGMEQWATQRETWHAPGVANYTVQRTREYAKKRFLDENDVHPRGFILAGPSPVCGECIEVMGEGVVNRRYVSAHPMPAHFHCDHEWEEVPGAQAPPLAEVWLGR
jgi:hypothetical protein